MKDESIFFWNWAVWMLKYLDNFTLELHIRTSSLSSNIYGPSFLLSSENSPKQMDVVLLHSQK